MANYVEIPVKNPGDPARAVDYNQTNENLEALAEGAAGAPRVQTAAIQNAAVTSAKLATGTNESNWVLGRNAGAAVGAVGTYAFCGTTDESDYAPGSTIAGSSLRYAAVHRMETQSSKGRWSSTAEVGLGSYQEVVPTSPAGTWRCMGNARYSFPGDIGYWPATLWLRIS